MKERRVYYEKEFKLMAVELLNSEKSSQKVAEELGLTANLVRRWKREFDRYNQGSLSGKGVPNLTSEQKEIYKLKKELADSRLETEILKKAISIFSKKDRTNTNL